jgi:hypothetical protein
MRKLAWIFVGVAILHVGALRPAGAERPSVGDVLAAWTARQAKVQSYHGSYRTRTEVLDRFSRPEYEWPTLTAGEKDVDIGNIWIDGPQVRVEGATWTDDEDKMEFGPFSFDTDLPDQLVEYWSGRRFDRALVSRFQSAELEYRAPQKFTSTCNGKTRTNVWYAAPGRVSRVVMLYPPDKVSCGLLDANALYRGGFQLDSLLYQALMIALRPFHPLYGGVDPSRCELLQDVAVIRGRRCLCVRESPGDSQLHMSRRFWVDSERDFVVMRYIGEAPGQPTIQIDIDYDHRAPQCWLPSSWHVIRVEPAIFGILDRTQIVSPLQRCASLELRDVAINESPSAVSFEPEYATGAWVVDGVHEAEFIVRANGARRELLELEYRTGVPFEALVKSEPGHACDNLRRLMPDWPWLLCGIIAGIGIGMLIWTGMIKVAGIRNR